MTDHDGPRFRVFDVVQIEHVAPDLTGQMVVGEVRRYDDNTYRYSVWDVDRNSDDWNGLYGEIQLAHTGERVDKSVLDIPGPFTHRDIVIVSADYEDRDIAGQTGVVESWYEGDGVHPVMILVRFDELARSDVIVVGALTATGGQVPRPVPDGRATTSAIVATDGSLLGREDYVIVDGTEFYL